MLGSFSFFLCSYRDPTLFRVVGGEQVGDYVPHSARILDLAKWEPLVFCVSFSRECAAFFGCRRCVEDKLLRSRPRYAASSDVSMTFRQGPSWNMSNFAPAEIVSLDEICSHRASLGKVGCTSGGFDPLHPGHVNLLLSAKAYCEVFVVFVSGDEFLRRKKGRPFMEHLIRCMIIAGIRGVDYVVPYENEEDQTISNGLRLLMPNVFLKGGDRVDESSIPESPLCRTLGIEVVVPERCKGKTGVGSIPFSSSFFLDRWSGAIR